MKITQNPPSTILFCMFALVAACCLDVPAVGQETAKVATTAFAARLRWEHSAST